VLHRSVYVREETRQARPHSRPSQSGERKRETEERKDNLYRSEREHGSFYRAVPLPEGVTLEDVKATFSDGVLEVCVPLPARSEASVRKVQIEEPKTAAKSAA
jgi:HSP20 family protein